MPDKIKDYISNTIYFNNWDKSVKTRKDSITFRSKLVSKTLVDIFEKSNKNRVREMPTFANINLMGKCNLKCYFCVGKELKEITNSFGKNIDNVSHMNEHFSKWKNFIPFLNRMKENDIKKLYLTGLSTDPAIYKYLSELIDFLKERGFNVGIRTNGYYRPEGIDKVLSSLNEEVSYSIHSFNPEINKKIIGTTKMPDWDKIIPASGDNVRIATIVSRYNKDDILSTIKNLSKYSNIKYIQLRAICSDININEYAEDRKAFDELKNEFSMKFKQVDDFKKSPIYEVFGKRVSFWDALGVNVNSNNYFTDGTFTDSPFVIEGYAKSNLLK